MEDNGVFNFIQTILEEKGEDTVWRYWHKGAGEGEHCDYFRIVYVFNDGDETYLGVVYDDDTGANYNYLGIVKFNDIVLAWSAIDQEDYNEMT